MNISVLRQSGHALVEHPAVSSGSLNVVCSEFEKGGCAEISGVLIWVNDTAATVTRVA
jgi:hypothetical protein